MIFDTIKDVRCFLDNIPKFQVVGSKAAHMGLDQIERFCEIMGDPQNDLPAIHVAGTNGKGTVCHILAQVYTQAGYKVGLYTSPHLFDFKERIKINGLEIPDDAIVLFFKEYSKYINRYHITYFELLTALAFWWFKQQRVDLAVIETGLGGRLDATNVVKPLLSVITSISYDHKEYLGDTIEAIAFEKAGIIKEKVPLILGGLPENARQVIQAKAYEKGSEVYSVDSLRPVFKNGIFELTENNDILKIKTDLIGPIQAINLGVGWQVIKCLLYRYKVSNKQFLETVKDIRLTSGLRARFEPLKKDEKWYFDGAHNIEAIRVLKNTIKNLAKNEEPVIILSLMRDKIDEKIVHEFSEFKKIYYYEINTGRAAKFEEVKRHLQQIQPLSNEWGNIFSLLQRNKSRLVIFTGSFYFYNTVSEWIKRFNRNCM